jgi:hypothetical protein
MPIIIASEDPRLVRRPNGFNAGKTGAKRAFTRADENTKSE